MLTEKDKLNQWRAFVDSDKFGTDTSTVIYLLGKNVVSIIGTIELYGVLLRKLDEGAFNDVLTNTARMTEIKQHIMLDMIMKTETIIESFLVFINHLSDRYKGLAETMTYYDQNLIRTIMDKVRKKQSLTMRKALALPIISHLHLDKEEAKLLVELYRESESTAWNALSTLVEFYDKFRIVYGKSKHGLTFATDVTIDTGDETQTSSTSSQFENSGLIAYDRKRVQDMPRDFIEVTPEDLSVQDWFNANAHLNFGQNLMAEIFTVTEAMKTFVPYVCRSHIIYALNCGVGYLPYQRINEKEVALDFLLSPSGVEEMTRKQRTFESLSSKIIPNMNTNEQEFGLRINYKNPKLVQSIKSNTVTNMRYKETERNNIETGIWRGIPLFLSRLVRCISSSTP